MRENPKTQDSTWVLPFCFFTFLPKVEYDPMLDTHILVQGFGRKQEENKTGSQKKMFLTKTAA